ncbi:fatty acyl-AMP ligase [Nannocystaceae bacterium ST9]
MSLESASTLVDVLHERARLHGERPLYQQVSDGQIVASLDYAQADRRARALALRLREHARVGDRVLLLYPFGLEYPVVFLACLYAGVVAVPAFPPDRQRAVKTMPRVSAIVRDADAHLILTSKDLVETVEIARAEARDPASLRILATEDLGTSESDAELWRRPEALERELAFLQYTSGSTGTPKGAMIGHDNLYAHQRLAHEKFRQPEAALTVSWLPFYHDMGLIGSLLYPLFHGGTTLLMSPTAFLRRPLNWLTTISQFQARVSTGPNFAYDLCVLRASEADLESLDLSSWHLTVSGAEPLRASTLENFTHKFARCGFRPQTFMPCFGMAETTLMVSGWPLERSPKIAWFDRAALLEGRAVSHATTIVAAEGDHLHTELRTKARPFVSCGTPMRDHELAIVDPETLERLPEARQGEIWVRGPSVGRGYWGAPAASEQAFAARIAGEVEPAGARGWFRTGDTGLLFEGELFGTGRLADRIEVGGRVYQPHDIERSVSEGAAPLAPDCVVFLARGPQAEPLLCLAATGRRTVDESVRVELCEAIHARVLAEHGLDLDRVLLIPERSVAKTTSGKLRRHRYRSAFADGELEILAQRSR